MTPNFHFLLKSDDFTIIIYNLNIYIINKRLKRWKLWNPRPIFAKKLTNYKNNVPLSLVIRPEYTVEKGY
jgi:hypothetical protein